VIAIAVLAFAAWIGVVVWDRKRSSLPVVPHRPRDALYWTWFAQNDLGFYFVAVGVTPTELLVTMWPLYNLFLPPSLFRSEAAVRRADIRTAKPRAGWANIVIEFHRPGEDLRMLNLKTGSPEELLRALNPSAAAKTAP
jgi:hypothetical protein